MITIHKFSRPVEQLEDVIYFDMPTGAKVLSVGNQNEKLCIWAEVDDSTPKKTRRGFRVAGTGHPKHIGLKLVRLNFIGTVMFADGKLVFHIYEGS